MSLSPVGKMLFFFSAMFGAFAYLNFTQESYGTCLWYMFCAGVEFHFAMKCKKERNAT